MKKTYQERQAEKALVDRVQAAGIPIAIESTKNEVSSLLIRQDFDAYESMLFNLNGGTGLILPIKISVDIPVFVFSGVDIRLSRWPNAWFRPLEENDQGEWPHYDFWGRSELKFHRNESINRFLGGRTQFRRGGFLRGLLLAFCHDPLPEDIVRGEILQGSIEIFDHFEQKHSAKISLRVHREVERERKPNPRRERLFARPDFKARGESTAAGHSVQCDRLQ
jgi:hypothetical protein